MIQREEEPISRHLPLRGEGCFERWIEVADAAELLQVVRAARAERRVIRPIPPFHDALPPDGGLSGVALRLGVGFEQIGERPEGLWVGASVPLALVGLRRGYASLRRAPGTLLDAWEEGWILPSLLQVRRLRGRGIEDTTEVAADPKALLLGALIRPDIRLKPPQAGAAFVDARQRGMSTSEILHRAKLSGLRVHGAVLATGAAPGEPVSAPLLLINRGDARPRHLRLLLSAVLERVQAATGLTLTQRLPAPGRGGRL